MKAGKEMKGGARVIVSRRTIKELLHWMRPSALAAGFPADAVPASQEGARLRVKWRLMEMQMFCIYDELEDPLSESAA